MKDNVTFVDALRSLLDDTDLFERKDWAKFLGVSEEKINTWLSEEDIPRPFCLSMIFLALKNSSDVKKEPLKRFSEMAKLRSTTVSKLGKRMLPSVTEYMDRPIFSELSNRLAKLKPEEQEQLLEELYPEI